MRNRVLHLFLRSEAGATVIEYAIMASLIAAVVIVIVTSVGQKTLGLYEDTDAAMAAAFP